MLVSPGTIFVVGIILYWVDVDGCGEYLYNVLSASIGLQCNVYDINSDLNPIKGIDYVFYVRLGSQQDYMYIGARSTTPTQELFVRGRSDSVWKKVNLSSI